jgi:hypothetical protein
VATMKIASIRMAPVLGVLVIFAHAAQRHMLYRGPFMRSEFVFWGKFHVCPIFLILLGVGFEKHFVGCG